MKVIKASDKYLGEIIPLFDQYRVFYKQSSNLEAANRFLKERIQKKDSVIFIALDSKGRCLGFTQLYPSFSSVSMQRTYILNDLFVAVESRKKGIGEALMEAAKQFAMLEGSKALTLETAIDNPAQKLYRRLGWKKDEWVNHYTLEI